ncbi:hypothetical protein Tco_0707117 [Tanacetum coccineum]|uniref:Uncharacterized protein n=1 Tax=Tanacetum coccineum TaxID=301880 RepID=A0ABQ4Y9E4_9ASTR
MWAADRVVAPTPGSAITIPKTANEFAIKGNHLTLVKGNQFNGRIKTGSSNSDTDKIMAQMDAMTMKMDAQYKELQSRPKQPNTNHNDNDTPMSREEEAKFMQTFCRTRFYNDYRDPHYLYMAKIQEVILVADETFGPIFDKEPLEHVQTTDEYNVYAMENEHPVQLESISDTNMVE